MILSDADLLKRLPELQLSASNPNFEFKSENQVQCCSIDLRLSDLFWKPRRFRTIDLSDSTTLGPRTTNAFRRIKLKYPNGLVLKPGQFILGRTYESFEVPPDLMGLLVGRSSVGRFGLSVVAPSNFINPGWRGHMPLMLINHSPFRLRIHPYLGIVQLCLMTFSSKPDRLYGADGLGSKYMDHEGGPSKYWLDHTIKALAENLNLKPATPEVEVFLERLSRKLDEPTRSRLSRAIEKYGVVADLDSFLEFFIQRERRRAAGTIVLAVAIGIPVAMIGLLPPLLSTGLLAIGLGVLIAASIIGLTVWLYLTQFATSISVSELRRLAQEAQGG